MHPIDESVLRTRRSFLATGASGAGTLALASLLQRDGLLADDGARKDPLAPRRSHFPARADACIFIYLAGAPSQLELFNPKPALKKWEG